MKKKLTEWGRIFNRYESDRGLMPRINKELKTKPINQSINQTNKPMIQLKTGLGYLCSSSVGEIKIAKKYLKEYLVAQTRMAPIDSYVWVTGPSWWNCSVLIRSYSFVQQGSRLWSFKRLVTQAIPCMSLLYSYLLIKIWVLSCSCSNTYASLPWTLTLCNCKSY